MRPLCHHSADDSARPGAAPGERAIIDSASANPMLMPRRRSRLIHEKGLLLLLGRKRGGEQRRRVETEPSSARQSG